MRQAKQAGEEPAGSAAEYVPLALIGQIREKGFSSSDSSASTSRHWNRVSPPVPRVTPFPIARHRSDGPHWVPPSPPVQSVSDVKEDLEDNDGGEQLASSAQPLVRKKKKAINFSRWKTENGQKAVANLVRDSDTKDATSCTQSNVFASNLDAHEGSIVTMARSIEQDTSIVHVSNLAQSTRLVALDSRSLWTSTSNREEKFKSPSGIQEEVSPVNESTLESMTNEQIAEAQQELAERFRPDILDMLRRRGKQKAEKQKNNESSEKVVLPIPNVREESLREPKQRADKYASGFTGVQPLDASPSITQTNLGNYFPWGGRSWTERVEAVRLYRFGLGGEFVGIGSGTSLPAAGDTDSQWRILNVTERDFLRMEGDPSSYGYTIKEAVALARSMVPAQRSAALRLLSNILNKAMLSLQSNGTSTQSVDWQAVWAYALGPEPELVLTLRMALDDSHATAVVTCARALEFLLSSSANEHYFNLCESLSPGEFYEFTAPIFQKPLFKESGLIGECHWKYNVKPTEMFPYFKGGKSQGEDTDATVKDDASVANQDVAAGLIRMGILPRIRYLLEVERLTSAEDSLFTILIALSRHSPAAADAVMKCPRLMDTIRQLFFLDETLTWPARPKAIKLLKVLSIAKKSNCIQLLDMGIFESSQRGLLRQALTLGTPKRNHEGSSWVELVESLGYWRICIKYGLCISCFSDLYPVLLFWSATPRVRQPIQASFDLKNATLAESSFHLLEALATTLPILHNTEDVDSNTAELSPNVWSWKFAIPIVENSLGWLSVDFTQSCTQKLLLLDVGNEPVRVGFEMLVRIISSVLHFLSTLCDRILDEGTSGSSWLPIFVPKLGLELVRSGLLGFSGNGSFESGSTSLVKYFFKIKENASGRHLLEVTNCLHGLVRLLKVLDRLFASVELDKQSSGASKTDDLLGVEEILKCGLVMSAKDELMQLLRGIGSDLIKVSGVLNMRDTSRRGGPAPGIGIGWGCQGGGYWSHQMLAAQNESVLVVEVMELLSLKGLLAGDLLHADQAGIYCSGAVESWRIKVGCSVSLLAGPSLRDLVERVCCGTILSMSSLNFYLRETGLLLKRWLWKLEKDKSLQEIENHLNNLNLKIEDIKNALLQHVRSIWLCRKVKSRSGEVEAVDKKHAREVKSSKRSSLCTIPEDSAIMSASYDRESIGVQWAGQRLPLPSFWFLSPLLSNGGQHTVGDGNEAGDVIRHGLLLLFGLEALSKCSPALGFQVPIVRKLHCLSNLFVLSDDIFLEKSVSSMVGALQEMYMNQLLTSEESESVEDNDMEEQCAPGGKVTKDIVRRLDFEGLIDERYSSFLDRLTSQFASVSYGDLVFSRQVAIYLTRDVSESLRLRVWKSLETEHMLEFLPPLEQCCGPCAMYLYPKEKSEELLKAYASAWASGALDRARVRQSLSFSLAVFHVASFIFNKSGEDKAILLRKTFAKDFLLQLSWRPHFQESLLELLNCKVPLEPIPPGPDELKLRCIFLEEACAQYPILIDQIQQLKNV